MQTTVISISPPRDEKSKYIPARVRFVDETSEGHPSCIAEVFIENKDLPLSELQETAIRQAVELLSNTVSAHSNE